jgi:hypothetical protein
VPRGGSGVPGDAALEDVTFKAPMRVLFWKKWARTTVRQAAAWAPGANAVDVRFDLIHSVRAPAAAAPARVRHERWGRR